MDLDSNGWIKKKSINPIKSTIFFVEKKPSDPSIKDYVHLIHPILDFNGWIIHPIHQSMCMIFF
jgi:hypothetical protein